MSALSLENAEGQKPSFLTKKAVSLESFVFLGVAAGFFTVLGMKMGAVNLINTMMNTAFDLLVNTALYIMAVAVLAGAVSGLLTEFGVVSLLNKLLSPLMKPLYGLPGASIVGIFATYLSDNPAILTLADDTDFHRYFKPYQLPALTNLGTAFGMGLITTTVMIGITAPSGEHFFLPALIGNLGTVIGSIVSVRLMLGFSARAYGRSEEPQPPEEGPSLPEDRRLIRQGGVGGRCLGAILDGGKSGVSMGLAIIPGILIICTLVMILTNGPSAAGYTGGAYEGVAFLPWISQRLSFILSPLFGFTSPEAMAVPITALGSAGAAIGLVPQLVNSGLAGGRDIAVFTAMCMCWSGYLSTHVAMMDTLGCKELTGKAIFSHTVGGIVAGISANWLCALLL